MITDEWIMAHINEQHTPRDTGTLYTTVLSVVHLPSALPHKLPPSGRGLTSFLCDWPPFLHPFWSQSGRRDKVDLVRFSRFEFLLIHPTWSFMMYIWSVTETWLFEEMKHVPFFHRPMSSQLRLGLAPCKRKEDTHTVCVGERGGERYDWQDLISLWVEEYWTGL
jgi:hypothetical protein